MNILALDLGAQMGWALTKRDGSIIGGSEAFAPAKHGGHGPRFLAFMTFLSQLRIMHGEIHVVYFEDVKRHAGTLAAHAYGGFLAILQVWCSVNGKVPMYALGVGQIKKAWTGKGNADKATMIVWAKNRGLRPLDDNHADAMAILMIGCNQEGKPFPAVAVRITAIQPQGELV